MENARADRWLELYRTAESPRAAIAPDNLRWLGEADDAEIVALLNGVCDAPSPEPDSAAAALLAATCAHLARAAQQAAATSARHALAPELRVAVIRAYRQVEASLTCRQSLLLVLASSGDAVDLASFVELLVVDPPATADAAALALAPLFRRRDYDAGVIFPRLLEALGHAQLAGAVLDLANYFTRERLVERHPAADRAAALASLLGNITDHLGKLAERPAAQADSGEALARLVADSVALAVSLCDALGLIGDATHAGKLYRTLSLGHRRLRVEAAAALARLGEEEGRKTLTELAAEPVARLRVLAYATELGLLDRVPEQFRTPASEAEAELVSWLGGPTQFGLSPQECELVDQCTRFWPGFEEPVACFLFRFTYRLGGGSYSNIGIAGPLTHAFTADITGLPIDDQYALFAGWQAEHDDIYERDFSQCGEYERVDAARLERRLLDDGYHSVTPLALGMFFGDRVLIARAQLGRDTGVAVADRDEVLWLPQLGPRSPGRGEAFCLYKGRKLLRAFNET